ncbi:ribonuclease P Rpr2/Rpp21/SNM1 subunit [Aspergillus puulaauensis]|uniref:Cullin binding protein CanA n=1 Tax=Aspergillus puulaauensis TaxID=1220207 RepID=A0A7R7XFQ5_9EURO|nr:uncharacterized protein APUU_20866S [Aspergillus puulaauensis]BCS20434.1 hypothetical protein APUU_20866S [Aspergillus puulaauensis]
MHFKEYTPRLNFLKDSASSLSSTSPSTAAYLMSAHNVIFHEEHKPLNQRLHDSFCGACGSPRNSEWTKVTSIKKKNQKRATSSLAKGLTAEGATVHKCLRCRRRTVTQPRAPSKSAPVTVPIVDSRPSSSAETPALPEQVSASKTTENASSKKRAKARKQGGLQALLATKQSQSDSTKSLDLFDFLQQ